MGVEEERQPGRERLDVHAAREAELDVTEAVGERERKLLSGRRAGLPDVVTRDRERLVGRDLGVAVLHQVTDEAKVRLGREQPLLLRDVLLEDVGLQRAVEHAEVDALTLCRHEVHAEDRDGRAADRHRRRDVGERDVGEEQLHVGRGVDRDAAVADLAERAGVVGVTPHQRRHVERHRQPAAPGPQDHLVPLVRLHRVAEPGELADRPGPAAISRRVQAPGERELAWPADAVESWDDGALWWPVHGLDLDTGDRREVGVTYPRRVERGPPSRPAGLEVVLLRCPILGVVRCAGGARVRHPANLPCAGLRPAATDATDATFSRLSGRARPAGLRRRPDGRTGCRRRGGTGRAAGGGSARGAAPGPARPTP